MDARKSNRFGEEARLTRHHLKILTQYYEAQINGCKNFELRKMDRSFKVGDEIQLNEICARTYKPTGRSCIVRITYILTNGFEGLEDGFGVLNTELIRVL